MRKLIRKYSSTIHGNYKKKSLCYGLIIGVLMSIFLLGRYLFNYLPSSPITLFDNILLLIVMICSVYLYKKSLPDNKISFKEAFLLAFYSAVIGAIVYGIFLYFYISVIDTQMMTRCADKLRQIPEYSSYSSEDFTAMTRASVIVMQSIIYNVVMAVLWAFVAAVIMKNEPLQQKK